MEKEILDNYKSDTDFKRLLDNITLYSDYSFFNSLLIDYQYPDFLDLGTKQKYLKNGFDIVDPEKVVRILSPNNDIYVKIKKNNREEIKLLNNLSKEELRKFNDPKDSDIVFHRKDFKGLDILELFDCKDTNMTLKDYKNLNLPALFGASYDDIYNSFVKVIYTFGYKVKYVDNLDSKFSLDKDNNIINIRNGLSSQIKILSLLEVYSSEMTNNSFDKELMKYVISKGIGIDDDFDERFSLLDWYKKTDIKSVDTTLKVIVSKGRTFINKFNKFYGLEQKFYLNKDCDLYEEYNLRI